MDLILSFLTLLTASLRMDWFELLNTATKGLVRGVLFMLGCAVSPVVRLRAMGKRALCPPITDKLLLVSAKEISRQIRAREVTSEKVVMAYINRCRDVNPVVNAIVGDRFELALQEAREVDKFLASTTKSQDELEQETPLLGVPFTVKESIGVEGMSNAAGIKTKEPMIAKKDADVVRRVRKAGGIPLLVSNTPELCMCWESFNNVTGTTVNPYNPKRTSGGSSGGEAALLGAGASLLSLSSDIGGSARLPAMFCGVFGHKPTPEWVSTVGHMPDSDDKRWANFFTIAPMARYAEDLSILLKVMCQYDECTKRLEKKVELKDIKFFYMEDDCGSIATSAVDREMKQNIRKVVEYMETTHGIKVQQVRIEDMKYAFEVAATILLTIDGADSIFKKGDNPREWKSVTKEVLKYLCFSSPHTFPNVTYGILKRVSQKTPKSVLNKMLEKNVSLKKQFEDLLGNNGVFIYPTFTGAAHYPYEIFQKVSDVSYMMIFNAMGLPVTQCPMGLNKNDLPIGLQVVANPHCDLLSLTVAEELQRGFGGWLQPPSSECTV